ncbi:hypothetical protein BSFA1_87190 (plasmid) [Burkholderia sp. SFA1]|nr:hypothetical protein BSFA1_87190 [Burkholderia sp. SFA1]
MNWTDEFLDLLYALDRADARIPYALSLKYKNLPPRLFKYRSISDHSLKNLSDDTVWLADPRTFNDPYDCHHFINFSRLADKLLREMPPALRREFPADVIEQVENAIAKSLDADAAVMAVMFKDEDPATAQALSHDFRGVLTSQFAKMGTEAAFAMKDGFKVCSFSERSDSTLMWAHYANYHSGFCIEYDISSLPFRHPLALNMYPVIYREKPFDATESFIRYQERNRLHLNMAALVKSTDWSYEKEWRLVFSNGVLATPGPFKMPKPKAVYLGSHIGENHATDVLQICTDKGIPVYKMQHSLDSFGMRPSAV